MAVGISMRPLQIGGGQRQLRDDKRFSRCMTTVKKRLILGQTTVRQIEMSHTHLHSFMIRSMSSPTRSTNSRSLLLSASMIVGSASSWSSILSASAGVGLDDRKGEGAWLSAIGKEDKTVGIVKGSALGERVVVREEGRVASARGDEEDDDNLEGRMVIETARVDVSKEKREEGKRGG